MKDLISKRCKSCEIVFTALHEETTHCPKCALGNQDYQVLRALKHLYTYAKDCVRTSRNPTGGRKAAFQRCNESIQTLAYALGYPSTYHFEKHLAELKGELNKEVVRSAHTAD